jgi:hypothetical protein
MQKHEKLLEHQSEYSEAQRQLEQKRRDQLTEKKGSEDIQKYYKDLELQHTAQLEEFRLQTRETMHAYRQELDAQNREKSYEREDTKLKQHQQER